MLRLYIVRHGETLFNIQHKVQGWCDSPLTETGILQAKAAGIGLREINFRAAFTSTSERAVDTAHAILEGRDVPLFYSKKWKEFHFGIYEGNREESLFSEIKEVGPHMFDVFGECGGDTSETCINRILSGMEEIRERYADGNILVVSHGGSIMMLASSLNPELARMATQPEEEDPGSEPKDAPKGMENCSVTTVCYDGGWKLEQMGDVSCRDRGMEVLKSAN
ncbi:MAG: histidine phosphatase family protein [Lachnospiraceae bacterium]|nr:histidine phosphatase family protein [Lachnospiraceae bacterium]